MCSRLFCTFLCRCFALLQHETSRNFLDLDRNFFLNILWRKCCMCICSLFFSLPLIFTLVATGISHFPTAAIKFLCYSSNKICVLCFLSLTLALSLLSHVNVDIKVKWKERIGFVVGVVLIARSPGGYAICIGTRMILSAIWDKSAQVDLISILCTQFQL